MKTMSRIYPPADSLIQTYLWRWRNDKQGRFLGKRIKRGSGRSIRSPAVRRTPRLRSGVCIRSSDRHPDLFLGPIPVRARLHNAMRDAPPETDTSARGSRCLCDIVRSGGKPTVPAMLFLGNSTQVPRISEHNSKSNLPLSGSLYHRGPKERCDHSHSNNSTRFHHMLPFKELRMPSRFPFFLPVFYLSKLA